MIRITYIERLIGVNFKNHSEFEDKIPRIPEILKSQIIRIDIIILYFEIMYSLLLILKQFYQKVNTMVYPHQDEHFLHKNKGLKFAD